MEKYGRVLVIIFFLILINLGISLYTLSKINRPVEIPKSVISAIKPSSIPTPNIQDSNPPSIQSDLNLIRSDVGVIKAEIRALREALDVTGLITATPTP